MNNLAGRRVLALAAEPGIKPNHLSAPIRCLEEHGAAVDVGAPDDAQTPLSLNQVSEINYDLLLLPGGFADSDRLRIDVDAQRIVRVFAATHKPVASMGYAPWLLIDAGLVNGKRLTSAMHIRSDVENAGGIWEDRPVVRCTRLQWPLITARSEADLKPFVDAIDGELSWPRHPMD